MSFCNVIPAGSCPAVTKGWLLPLTTLLLLPVFCSTVLVWPPFRAVRNGAVFGFMRLLRLLMLSSGVPPWSGKKLLLATEKGMPLMSVRAIIPVTTLDDGLDPPRMSCMKKDNGGDVVVVCGPLACATVALVATTGAGPLGDVVVPPPNIGAVAVTGGVVGATSATGPATVAGTSVSGSGG